MHGVVRNRLEDLLRADRSKPLPEHLASCAECLSELNLMKSQSMQLAALRAAEVLEPSPGFYARVLQRIEESEYDSFWAFFVDSTFSKRLAAASLTIAAGAGYVYGVRRIRGPGSYPLGRDIARRQSALRRPSCWQSRRAA